MSSSTRSGKESGPKANGKPTRRSNRNHVSQGKSSSPPNYDSLPWQDWVSHLAKRKTPREISRVIDAESGSPLLWADAEIAEADCFTLVNSLHRQMLLKNLPTKQIAQQLEQWLSDSAKRKHEISYALECLAWSYALSRLASILPAAPWWELHDHLVATAQEASVIEVKKQPLLLQLLSVELPLTLAYLFPELSSCRALATAAGRAYSEDVKELLDSNGMITGEFVALMRPLLACWTRVGYLDHAMKKTLLDKTAKNQFEWLIRQTMRFTRRDGTQVLCETDASRWCPGLLRAALKLAGDADDNAIAALAIPPLKGTTAKKKPAGKRKKKLPETGSHSEWAETALLRSDWSRTADQLTVVYKNRSIRAELNANGQTIFSGPWDPQIEIDGRTLLPQDDWEEVCWYSDEDTDYVELEMGFDRGWKIQRQMLLARNDRILLVGDAILGSQRGRIQYRCMLPLAEDIQFIPAEETNEGILKGKTQAAHVLPLALSEWRSERSFGSLTAEKQGLLFSMDREGQRLYAPLFFDMHPRRKKSRLTWRQLTVAEQLEIQQDDVAVGYRAQVGFHQWLFYRSLGTPGNRTLLGQNFSSEFFAGRFHCSGETDEFLEIE